VRAAAYLDLHTSELEAKGASPEEIEEVIHEKTEELREFSHVHPNVRENTKL
jgi:hypothetical protein